MENIEKFKQFQIDYTLKWNNDLDLAPEYLYFKAFENGTSLQEKFQEWVIFRATCKFKSIHVINLPYPNFINFYKFGLN